MRIAFATCSAMPAGSPDDHLAAQLLGAEFERWDDDGVDWESYDRVVLRSVWDYSSRVDEFLAARFGTPLYARVDLVAGDGGAPCCWSWS